MLLLNPTDEPMRWEAAITAPYVNGSEEVYTPPHLFAFGPGATEEVPDEAGQVLLDHLGPRGLVRIGLGDDLEEARERGRRAWFDWCEMQVRRHQDVNDEQRNNGLKGIKPNPHIRAIAKTFERLKASPEFKDELLDIAVRDTHITDQSALSADPVLAAAAERARGRAAQEEAEPASA